MKTTARNQDLIGQTFVDPHTYGDLTMEIVSIDELFPDKHIIVKPVGYNTYYWRNADIIRQIIKEANI